MYLGSAKQWLNAHFILIVQGISKNNLFNLIIHLLFYENVNNDLDYCRKKMPILNRHLNLIILYIYLLNIQIN